MNTSMRIQEAGAINVFHRTDNGDLSAAFFHNDAVNTSAMVIANALGGKGGITYLYIKYCDSDTDPSHLSISPVTSLQDFISGDNSGCLRVPVALVGLREGSSGKEYSNNVVLQGITGYNDTTVSDGDVAFKAGSKVFAVGLASEVNGAPVLFSVANIKDSDGNNSYVQKVANAQIGVNWDVEISLA